MAFTYIAYDSFHNGKFEVIENVIKNIETIDNKWILDEIRENNYFFCKSSIDSVITPVIRTYLIIPDSYKEFNENITKEVVTESELWSWDKMKQRMMVNIEEYETEEFIDMLLPEKEVNFDILQLYKYGTVDISTGRLINGIYVSYPCICEYCSIDE